MRRVDLLLNKQISEFIELQVMQAKKLWIVLYDNRAIYCRTNYTRQAPKATPPKYLKNTYTTKGAAQSAAKRYNQMFNTLKFTVTEIDTSYEQD